MNWWVLVCSLMVAAGLLLQLGAPLAPVVAGLAVGAATVWWRNRSMGVKR
jgi:hypothetical protein